MPQYEAEITILLSAKAEVEADSESQARAKLFREATDGADEDDINLISMEISNIKEVKDA